MHFVLMGFSNEKREDYAAKLTKTLMQSYTGSDEDTLRALLGKTEVKSPVITPSDALPQPTAIQMKQVEELKTLAFENIGPLLAGEVVEEDRFSILAESYDDYPEGTAVLHRRTNLAEICFFFPNVRLTRGDLRLVPFRIQDGDSPTESVPLGVGEELLVDLAKKLAEMLGTALLAELFPEKMPPYFTEVFTRIQSIVKDELTQQTVEELKGEFDGVVRFVKNEYESEKANSGVTPSLLNRLQVKSDLMYDKVGRIMPERFSLSGLPIFLVGASIHLTMLQEIVIQKQKLGLDVEAKSSAQTFEDYANHAEETYEKLAAARNKGRVGKDQKCSASGGGGGVVCNWYIYWKDEISGKTSSKYFYGCGTSYKDEATAREAAKNALAEHLAAEIATLKISLGNPCDLAKSWRAAGKLLHG